MPPEEAGIFISTRDMYEQLVKLNEQFAEVSKNLATLAALMTDTRQEQDELEQRVQSLERWKYGLPVAYLGVLVSLIASLLKVRN